MCRALGERVAYCYHALSLPSLSQRLDSLREHLRHEQLQRLLQRTRQPRLRRKLQKCLKALLPMAK
jgi:hypothetical protein